MAQSKQICYCVVSPYDGKWSKTMVGFGPEDDHFVAELTYNYGVGEYRLGNDFLVNSLYIYIQTTHTVGYKRLRPLRKKI